jgi:hypothetical protein
LLGVVGVSTAGGVTAGSGTTAGAGSAFGSTLGSTFGGVTAGFAGVGLAGVGFAALGCTTAGVAGSIAATISDSRTIGARGSLTTGAELPPNWPMAQTDPAASATTPSKMATTIRFIRVSLKGVSKV